MKIDLMSGRRCPEGYVGVDIVKFPGVDIVADLEKGLPMFEDSIADEIRTHDAIEHIANAIDLVCEIWRVLKPGGLWDCYVPSTDGRGAWMDLMHKSWWNQNSFKYFTELAWCRDYYGRECIFDPIEWYTTPMNEEQICWVVFKGKAVK